jgi:hypothetical protein
VWTFDVVLLWNVHVLRYVDVSVSREHFTSILRVIVKMETTNPGTLICRPTQQHGGMYQNTVFLILSTVRTFDIACRDVYCLLLIICSVVREWGAGILDLSGSG